MNKLMTTGTLGLAAMVTTGLVAWQAPAFAAHGSDHDKAFKRDDDSQVLVTTVDDDDDDDTGLNDQTRTQTRTRTGGDNTGTNTRTGRGDGDDSRHTRVRDLTSDGPGSGNVDHSRHDTNDGTRHNTRG
ncbi:hypothetical protein [Nocardioides sp. YIM 152315]|uniref:hypothetical protein n=1 Tax=Nocardioides sp. YIM 152315 TaxID=3031760 RepID=UPI0023DC1B2A|nr:hypothetical protein [Nocardioides sp. YIM 152315]MDF1604173.1 hypothetical protein [Nocardioides sp. YIM 152315]